MEDFLKSQGVSDLRYYDSKGIMSKVYLGLQNGKQVIIHHTYPNDEQIYLDTKEKIIFVSSLLSKEGFPCSPIISSKEFSDGSFVLIQRLLPGTALGKRNFNENSISDSYDKQYVEKVMHIIKDLHKIKLSGFGFLKEGVGPYSTWREFLKVESSRWINNIYSKGPKLMSEEDKKLVEQTVKKLLEHPATDWNESCFVTGDMVNPSNILIENGEITGIVDFEWALAGDPAWEFAFGDMPINNYIESTGVNEAGFRERVKVCRFFFLLWAVNTHTKGEIKPVLYKYLKEELQYWSNLE